MPQRLGEKISLQFALTTIRPPLLPRFFQQYKKVLWNIFPRAVKWRKYPSTMRPRVPLNAQMHLEFFPPSRVLIVDKRGGGGEEKRKWKEGKEKYAESRIDTFARTYVWIVIRVKHDFPLKKRISFTRLDWLRLLLDVAERESPCFREFQRCLAAPFVRNLRSKTVSSHPFERIASFQFSNGRDFPPVIALCVKWN